jgi:23S rRNA U2552 (ribose-2'-O)-methylase RlmE/FtsJ
LQCFAASELDQFNVSCFLANMSSKSSDSACSATAIEIAWKLRWRGYDSEDAAVRALRRHFRGVSAADAASALRVASAVLERAIRILKPHLRTLATIYQSRREIGPTDLMQFEPELLAHFPDCSSDTLKAVLQRALVYHMR